MPWKFIILGFAIALLFGAIVTLVMVKFYNDRIKRIKEDPEKYTIDGPAWDDWDDWNESKDEWNDWDLWVRKKRKEELEAKKAQSEKKENGRND